MLGKTFKGMTDEMLAFQTRELLAREIARRIHGLCRPELVVEVAFDGIQRALATRRPRAALRPRQAVSLDKRAEDADTIDSVHALHERRSGGDG